MDVVDLEAELDTMLWLAEAFAKQEQRLCGVREVLNKMMLEEAWKIAMRSQHYLTVQCLDAPSESAWMQLYELGSDLNFLHTTSLTRCGHIYASNKRTES